MAAPHERVAQRAAVGRFRDTPDIYEGVDGEEPTGSASMTMVLTVQVLRDRPSGTETVVARDSSSARSFRLGLNSGTWRFLVVDGDPSTRRADASVTMRLGRTLIAIAAFEGGAEARIRVNGVTGSDAANAGYTEPSVNRALTIGALGATFTNPASSFAAMAYMIDQNNALSAAQMATLEAEIRDNLEQGRDLDFGLSALSPTHYWDARDAVIGGGGTRATWTDRIAGIDLPKNGSPESLSVPARFA